MIVLVVEKLEEDGDDNDDGEEGDGGDESSGIWYQDLRGGGENWRSGWWDVDEIEGDGEVERGWRCGRLL